MKGKGIISFPSPIGVLYISMIGKIEESADVKEFPSPIGVLYISILIESMADDYSNVVSVPYWGSLYFNAQEE